MATETPPITRLKAEVFAKFPQARNGGVYNCRTIAGSSTPSQHAWGNALDIMIGSNMALGDEINRWLRANKARLSLGTILWRVKDHYDHLHVEGSPKMRGTPPCMGGSGGGPSNTRKPQVFQEGTGEPETDSDAGLGWEDVPGVGEVVQVGEFLGRLFQWQTWVRVLDVVGGLAIGGYGLYLFAQEFGMPSVTEAIDKVTDEIGQVVPG